MAELDWALETMDAPKPKSKRKSDIDVADVETKLGKEYVRVGDFIDLFVDKHIFQNDLNDLKGLGALLFDDGWCFTETRSVHPDLIVL